MRDVVVIKAEARQTAGFSGLADRLSLILGDESGVRCASNVAYHRGMIRRRSTFLTVVVLLSACADMAAEESLEAILAEPLPAEAYVASVRCLTMRTFRRIEVLDENTLLMRGLGNRSWIAQTHQRCRGLRNEHLLDFQQRRGRICTGDSFRGFIAASERIVVTPVCGIRVIHEVDNDQVVALDHAIRAKRYTGTVLRSWNQKTATAE